MASEVPSEATTTLIHPEASQGCMHEAWGGALPRDLLRYLHVAGVLLLMLAHGATILVAFRVKREKDAARIGALLDLSRAAAPVFGVALLVVTVSGALLASLRHLWGAYWVWSSTLLFVGVAAAGYLWGAVPLNAVRRAAGIPYREKGRTHPARAPDHASLSMARHALVPWRLAVVAVGALLLILWLMMFRPALAVPL